MMPNVKQLTKSSLFSWNRKNQSSKQAAPAQPDQKHQASAACASQGGQNDSPAEKICIGNPFERLVAITSGASAHALLRPLGEKIGFLQDIECSFHEEEHQPIVAALESAANLLEPSVIAERHLEFALAAHSDESTTLQLLGSIEAALAILRRSTASTAVRAKLEQALRGWQEDSVLFSQGCRSISELHTLFILLDVKGDEVLLEQTAQQLCQVLQCSPSQLAIAMVKTKPWVEKALAAFAGGEQQDQLGRSLSSALATWRSELREACRMRSPREASGSDDAIDAKAFWQDYFSSVQNVSWPDFAEAFEEFVLNCRCPMDVLNQLRSKVDPMLSYQVSFTRWNKLAQEHVTVERLIDALMAEVTKDIGSRVYRQQPLKELSRKSKSVGSLRKSVESGTRSSSTSPKDESGAKPKTPQPTADNPKPSPGPQHEANNENSVTPLERAEGLRAGPRGSEQKVLAWDEYCAQLYSQHRPFWADAAEIPQAEEVVKEETLRLAALRMVQSNVAYTNRAMVLRVIAGNLAEDRICVQLPHESSKAPPPPSIVVCPKGSRFGPVTRFGRGSSRTALQLDYTMGEPIASRSHFSVIFDQHANKYRVADCGSKWGTFMKVTQPSEMSCGDWIRVGNVEFIVRFCGGGCPSVKGHSHYKLHCLRTLQEQRSAPAPSISLRPPEEKPLEASSSDEEQGDQVQQELPMLLSGRRRQGWISTSGQLAQQTAMRSAGNQSASSESQPPVAKGLTLPVMPLELDFISGARMGEKVVLTNRLSTLGRSEENSIQVNDSAFANVSRVHCMFEYANGRWSIRDNKSTNGTWRRLSCILEPSKLVPVAPGERILAGVHELQLEEAEMSVWCVPSAGAEVLSHLSQKCSHMPRT